MHHFIRAFTIVAVLAGPLCSFAGPSHLGQDIADHVVLTRDEKPLGFCNSFERILPNGQTAREDFTVPQGRVLVVTDVSWLVGVDPGNSGKVALLEIKLDSTITAPAVFRSQTVFIGPLSNVVGGTEHLTAGFLVGPETPICALGHVSNEAKVYGSSTAELDILVGLSRLVLHGYLIDFPDTGY